ncbi:MAG: hypothetical protein HY898_13295 [Deltaproteobacteria bacterium]|nr:hypothetical protein [Deltaproteobacteria bacterium]
MSALSRRNWLFVVLAVGLTALDGCNSPTLPLPPPSPPAIQSVMSLNGQAVIKGGDYAVEPHAKVTCLNHASNLMRETTADVRGAFVLGIEAEPGNTLGCWQQVDHLISDPVMVVVPPAQR